VVGCCCFSSCICEVAFLSTSHQEYHQDTSKNNNRHQQQKRGHGRQHGNGRGADMKFTTSPEDSDDEAELIRDGWIDATASAPAVDGEQSGGGGGEEAARQPKRTKAALAKKKEAQVGCVDVGWLSCVFLQLTRCCSRPTAPFSPPNSTNATLAPTHPPRKQTLPTQ